MSNKINHERSLPTNRVISYGASKIARRVAYANKSKPSYDQIKYYKFLRNLCIEKGIDAPPESITSESRSSLMKLINNTSYKLETAGVKWNYKEVNRYKFDKKGNVIDRITGEIITRREKHD